MKTLDKKTESETTNTPGRVFGVVLIACVAICRCDAAEVSLEPIELLDLPLSKLSSVTAETSPTARKLQEQREAKNQEGAKLCDEGVSDVEKDGCEQDKRPEVVTVIENRTQAAPIFWGFGSSGAGPFSAYPLLAMYMPSLTPPAEQVAEEELVKAEGGAVEALAEIARAGDLAESASVKTSAESALVEDAEKPVAEDKVWESRIAAPKDDSYEQMKLELKKVIYQVQAIDLEARQAKVTSDTELMAMGAAEGRGLETDANEVLVGGQKEGEQAKPPYTPVSDSTLKALEDIAEKADGQGAGLGNAVELAQILYRSGRLEQAAKVYRLAYQAAVADDHVAVEDKAWMLLQVGNCLRGIDTGRATEAYKQLVTEYANSMWKDMARTQLELLNWYTSDKPEELVASIAGRLKMGQ